MKFSKRTSQIQESITLKLNSEAQRMSNEGKKIYNLTAGQLPFRPNESFVEAIKHQCDFVRSFQYSPVAGEDKLRQKFLNYFCTSRNVEPKNWDCIISNGGKHAINNLFAILLNEGDEVVMLAPFWLTYPELAKIYGASYKVVTSNSYNGFVPKIDLIRKALTANTKILVINSPNNPAGIHYGSEWMKELALMLKDFPHVQIVSDEIYYELSYFDPKPTYFYQYDKSLLERTFIIDGISKTFAATGLRIGFVFGPKDAILEMDKFQGQTSSGANSLIQKSLVEYNLSEAISYLVPIKDHLRANAEHLSTILRSYNLDQCFYQCVSAFYFLFDFTKTPFFEKNYNDQVDHSVEICEKLLAESGIALVPGIAFGIPNSARLSLVSAKEIFQEAITELCKYLTRE